MISFAISWISRNRPDKKNVLIVLLRIRSSGKRKSPTLKNRGHFLTYLFETTSFSVAVCVSVKLLASLVSIPVLGQGKRMRMLSMSCLKTFSNVTIWDWSKFCKYEKLARRLSWTSLRISQNSPSNAQDLTTRVEGWCTGVAFGRPRSISCRG